jgi:hypothetical protein
MIDEFTIGLKLFIFDKLFMLDFCPFFWRFGIDEGEAGITFALGPLFLAVIY